MGFEMRVVGDIPPGKKWAARRDYGAMIDFVRRSGGAWCLVFESENKNVALGVRLTLRKKCPGAEFAARVESPGGSAAKVTRVYGRLKPVGSREDST